MYNFPSSASFYNWLYENLLDGPCGFKIASEFITCGYGEWCYDVSIPSVLKPNSRD